MCDSGQFIWKKVGNYFIPTIIRNGNEYFVASRMAQNAIQMYLKLFHEDVYNMCFNIDSYNISKSEGTLLTFINENHFNNTNSQKLFKEGEDYIIRLEDIQEAYTFFDKFYKKMTHQDSTREERCGFFILNKDDKGLAVPYCQQDGEKYVPVTFIDLQFGNIDLIPRIKLNKWSVTYLKMCYLTMRIDNESMYEDDKFDGIYIMDLVQCLELQQPMSLWIESDHLIRDLRSSNSLEIPLDSWFNKPGLKITRHINSATWKETNMDPPPGVDGPMYPEYTPGFTGGLNVVDNRVYRQPE